MNVDWLLHHDAVADFELPHSGTLQFEVGQTTNSFTLTARLDNVLEGEEIFNVTLTSADNNADISITNYTAEIIVEANPGSYGHVEVVESFRFIIMSEPTGQNNGKQVSFCFTLC